MSFLPRFHRPGGFLKLLQLVETSDAKTRDELFEMIAQEDPGWAHLLRLKCMTVERILNWPKEALEKVWPVLPLPLVVAIWQKSPTEDREKIESSLPRSYQSSFRKAVEETPLVDDAEAQTASQRMIAIIREMQIHGGLRFQEFDAGLDFDGDLADTQDPFKKAA